MVLTEKTKAEAKARAESLLNKNPKEAAIKIINKEIAKSQGYVAEAENKLKQEANSLMFQEEILRQLNII